MALTARDVIRAAEAALAGQDGPVLFAARKAAPGRQRDAVAALEGIARARRNGQAGGYRVPWADARPSPPSEQALTAAAVVWLSRLPTDPSQISDADAVELYRLSTRVRRGDDALLVRSLWEPVRAHHERKAAEAALQAARTAANAEVPAVVVDVLAGVLADEAPAGLSPGEAAVWARGRARADLAVVQAAAEADLAARIATAEAATAVNDPAA